MNEMGDREIAGFLDGDGCIGIYRVKRRGASSWHYVVIEWWGERRGR